MDWFVDRGCIDLLLVRLGYNQLFKYLGLLLIIYLITPTYLNVMISFIGSLLIIKCFTSQETVFSIYFSCISQPSSAD